jgi:polysaccharide biosynthesis transport protein
VRSTVTSYADQRVQIISQRVMTTQTLLGIIRRYDLYPKERNRESREAIIQQMRDDINLKMISADVIDPRSGLPRSATIAFSVSYTSSDPGRAAKVANELTTLYLNENLTSRTQLAQGASDFLEAEARRISKQIAELDARLSAFKEKNIDQLPELTTLNMSLLDRTEQELRDLDTRRSSLQQQRVYLEAQLAQIKPNSALISDTGERIMSASDRLKMLRSRLASARSLYSDNHPDIQRMRQEIAGLEAEVGDAATAGGNNDLQRRLEQARGELGQAREKYLPDHPDVQRLQSEVASLEEELAKAPVSQPLSGRAPVEAPDNPAYIQIQAQVEATNNELAALTRQISQLRAQATGYQSKIALSPVIEKEYRELARDYENANVKYREIRAKQMEAQVAQNLETDRKGERFTLIEPPLRPEEPVSPNRPVVFGVGLLLSLALAAGIAALLEAMDGTVRGREDMVLTFNTPPLAIIPQIAARAELVPVKGGRHLRLAAGAAAAVGLCTIAMLAVHFLYRPLDVLWFVALRRFGL